MTRFLKLTDIPVDKKAAVLREALSGPHERAFIVDTSSFQTIPGTPFAYWTSASVRSMFSSHPPLENVKRFIRQGLATAGDERFLRKWTEVPEVHEDGNTQRWMPFAKGGSFAPIYSDLDLVIEWHNSGEVLKAKVIEEHGNIGKRIYNEEFYRRPGITWPRRTNGLSFRVLPAGSIFSDKGPSIFVDGDSPECLLALCALVNSRVFGYLVSVQLARTELAQSFEVGLVQQTPMPRLSGGTAAGLARLARRAWSLKRLLDTCNEASHAFVLPPGINEKTSAMDRRATERELADIQTKIDEAAYSLYCVTPEDRKVIESAYHQAAATDVVECDEVGDDDGTSENEAPGGHAADTLNSWLVGVAFGRFDPRLVTGDRQIPLEPGPFDALPQRSPGMCPAGERPARQPDILVDDEGHSNDFLTSLRTASERVQIDVPETLRTWLANEFFPLHIKMYSKSRRKAPIYWQLATASASYSAWLYIHAFTKDTLFRVQNDYAVPKLAHEERALETLMRELGAGAASAQRKALAAQEAFVEELRVFVEEVKRVAPLWNPNLDDGVIINFAPLWRLVPQSRSWQKELKATWGALCEGKYDWSHLAMRFWPERVVPKCAADRSLAIAHGLEFEFWEEDAAGVWKEREKLIWPIEEIVANRSSAAVKAALKNLIDAPDSSGPTKRGRKSKAS